MGNSAHKAVDYSIVRSYRPQDWKPSIPKTHVDMWQHQHTHEKVEVYALQEIPSIEDMHRYQLRSSQEHLVRVYHIAVNQQMLCVASQFAQLLIEHIPLRLSSVVTLDLQEALTVMYAAFRGFHTIESLFGRCKPSDQLIGFNSEGKPKVWLNKQFQLNFCEAEIRYTASSQHQGVRSIFNMVTAKLQGESIAEAVVRDIMEKELTYNEAAEIIEAYAFNGQLSLRRFIRVDVLQRQLGFEKKLNRYHSSEHFTPSEKLTFSRHSQVKGPLNRFESCDSLNAKIASPLSQLQSQTKPFLTKASSFTSLSPASHHAKSVTKITFNNTPIKKIQQTLSPSGVLVQEEPKLDFVSFNPARAKLHKISANQIPTKPPQIVFARGSRKPHQHTTSTIQQISMKHSNIPQETYQQNKAERKQQEHFERPGRINQEATEQQSPGKITVASEQSIIEKVKGLETSKKTLEEAASNQEPELQFEAARQEVQVSGVFRLPHNQDKIQEGCPQFESEVTQKDEKRLYSFSPVQQKREIPINFESFAPSMENISFAPKNFDPDPTDPQNEPAHTSKSVQIEEDPQESAQLDSLDPQQQTAFVQVESAQDPAVISQSNDNENQAAFHEEPSQHSEPTFSRQKFESSHPLYNQCTPVQSKFHIILKKDSSNFEISENQHSHRASAFTQFQNQDAIKNEFNAMLQHGGIRLNRVSSQYEMHNEKRSEPAHSQRTMKKEGCAQVRSHINLGQPHNDPEDFLDVKFLEKSLDLKYRNMKKKSEIKEEEDELNISKLDQKLQKYSNSRISVNKLPQYEVADLPVENSKLVSELAIDSEKFESRKVTSIEYENSYLHKQKGSNQRGHTNGKTSNKGKVGDFCHLFQKEKDRHYNDYRERQGFNTVQGGGFASKTITYQSLERQRDEVKYRTYQFGQNWRKDTSKRQQMNSARKDSNKLLEERYEKYVKQSHRSSKRESTDYESLANQPHLNKRNRHEQRYSANVQSFQAFRKEPILGKRISYDHLRSILWN